MFAAFATAVHRASSSASILPNSAGVPILISAPSVCQPRARLRWAEAVAERGVELGDDVRRRAGRRHDAEPERREQLRIASLRRGRHVRQFGKALASSATASGRSLPAWMCGRLVVLGVGDHLDFAGQDGGKHRALSRDRARARC